MAWWSVIGNVLQGSKDVAEVFVENKENKGQRKHTEAMADMGRDMASLTQYSAEFHTRQTRTWWDSLADGLNRLPRPLMAIAILSFFVLAPLDPERFLETAKAYELMPTGYWTLVSVVISFYFGGRMQLKSHDMTVRKDAVKAAQELMAMKAEFRKLGEEDESLESKKFDQAVISGNAKIPNKVVAQWLKDRATQSA